MKARIFLTSFLFSSICFAGGETGGAGSPVILFHKTPLVLDQFTMGSSVAGAESLQAFAQPFEASRVKFVDFEQDTVQFIMIDDQSGQNVEAESNIKSLEITSPELLDYLEESSEKNNDWIEI